MAFGDFGRAAGYPRLAEHIAAGASAAEPDCPFPPRTGGYIGGIPDPAPQFDDSLEAWWRRWGGKPMPSPTNYVSRIDWPEFPAPLIPSPADLARDRERDTLREERQVLQEIGELLRKCNPRGRDGSCRYEIRRDVANRSNVGRLCGIIRESGWTVVNETLRDGGTVRLTIWAD